jgi:tetratricopeptide (TPR) repeat protein
MLRKSLVIASLIILNTASVSWSLEVAGSRRHRTVEQRTSLENLVNKLYTVERDGLYPEVEDIARQILRQDPHHQAALMFLGRALKEQGKLTAAESLYRQIIRQYPENRDTFQLLGAILIEQRKFTEAESLYRQRISKYPLDFETYEELGRVLTQQEKPEAALAVYRQALVANPPNSYIDLSRIQQGIISTLIQMNREDEAFSFIRQRLAKSDSSEEIVAIGSQLLFISHKHDRINESIAILREIIAKVPGSLDTYTHLGSLLVLQGKEAEAIEIYQQAIAIFQYKLADNPWINYSYTILGKLLERQQRQPEAIALYRKIITDSRIEARRIPYIIEELKKDSYSNSNDIFLHVFPAISAQISLNELLYKQQGWTAVLQEMQPIEQTTPEIAAFILRKFGDFRMTAKQYNEAIVAYQRSFTVDKQMITAYTNGNLFLVWIFTNQPQQAQSAYQQTLKLTPADKRQETIKRWAFILDKGGRKAEAIALYRQLLKTPDKKSLFLSLQLAKALQESGQATAATQAYQQIQTNLDRLKRTAPQDPNTYIMQGNLYSQLEQRQLAIDSYRRAIELLAKQPAKDPKQLSFSQLKLADNLRLTGQHPEAIAAYRQALEGCECTELKAYSPSTLHGMAYYGMGLSLQQQGNIAEARTAWKKAVDLDPDYEEARRAIDRQ